MAKKKVYIPRSHKGMITISMSPKRGLHAYARKRASRYNECIANLLRGKGGGKGSGRLAQRQKFAQAVATCAPQFKKEAK